MNIESLNKKLERVKAQIALLQEKEKELAAEKQQREDAATMKMIKKLRITAEKLQVLNEMSEEEMDMLLRERAKERKNNEQNQINI
jgi:hypothetical protein